MNRIIFKLIALFLLSINIALYAQIEPLDSEKFYPLNTYYMKVPGGSYIKDMKNELEPFVGIYKAIYKGNEITLFITEEKHRYNSYRYKKYYEDQLIIKFIVRDSTGKVLQDTQNGIANGNKIQSSGFTINNGKISFYYEGTNCYVGWGGITLTLLGNGKMKWDYRSNGIVFMKEKCSENKDFKVYLPDTQHLIFTKQ